MIVQPPYLQEPYLFVEQRGSTYYVNTNIGLQVCYNQSFLITLYSLPPACESFSSMRSRSHEKSVKKHSQFLQKTQSLCCQLLFYKCEHRLVFSLK